MVSHIHVLYLFVETDCTEDSVRQPPPPPFAVCILYTDFLHSATFNGQTRNPTATFTDIITALQVLQSVCLHCQIFDINIGFVILKRQPFYLINTPTNLHLFI